MVHVFSIPPGSCSEVSESTYEYCPPLMDTQLLFRLGVLMRKEVDVREGLHAKDFCWPACTSQGLLTCFRNAHPKGTVQS